MDFKLFVESKYLKYGSMVCIKCSNPLMATTIKVNPKHIYRLGQLFDCECGTARCWTNSVRNPQELLAHFETNAPYRRGFCNDMFCPYCAKYLYPLKNGYEFEGKRWDLYGCQKCEQNRMVMGNDRIPEGSELELVNWYKRHLNELKAGITNNL